MTDRTHPDSGSIITSGDVLRELHEEIEILRAGYAAARLEIESLKSQLAAEPPAPRGAPVAWLSPWRADQVTTDYDAYGEHGIALYTAPQQEAHHLTQALTDPENQPNQYGVEFGMSGPQMHFKIGNQLFRLAYEPDEQEEFDFMKRMLVHAFTTFTHDVKTAPQQEPSYTSVQLAEMVLSDCGHSSNYTPLLNRVAARIDAHVERCLDELRGRLEPQPSPAAQGDALDAGRWRRLVNASELSFPVATIADDPENCAVMLYGRKRMEALIDSLDEIPSSYADAALAAQGDTP